MCYSSIFLCYCLCHCVLCVRQLLLCMAYMTTFLYQILQCYENEVLRQYFTLLLIYQLSSDAAKTLNCRGDEILILNHTASTRGAFIFVLKSNICIIMLGIAIISNDKLPLHLLVLGYLTCTCMLHFEPIWLLNTPRAKTGWTRTTLDKYPKLLMIPNYDCVVPDSYFYVTDICLKINSTFFVPYRSISSYSNWPVFKIYGGYWHTF